MMGVKVVGTRKSLEEDNYEIIDVKGIPIAVLNYTYETGKNKGRKTLNNRLLDEKSAELVNSFSMETLDEDLLKIENDIKHAKEQGAKIIIVYYHWGYEYERVSLVSQKYIAYRTAQMGCDAIFGSHPHVLQESDIIRIKKDGKEKEIPVFYSLGNYIWGQTPMEGRETVLNGALAQLDIDVDTKTKEVVSIKKSHIPLLINFTKKDKSMFFDVLTLDDMDEESKALFDMGGHNHTIEQIRYEISQTINNQLEQNAVNFHFDRILEVPSGKKKTALGNIIPNSELYTVFKSEDAIIASVLQNGEIIGNSNGFTGITAITKDGHSHMFMVHVTGAEESNIPLLLDQNNRIRDIYMPSNCVTGDEWFLPRNTKLKKDAAEAWLKMREVAREEGVYLKCTSGFRTKKSQLIRINKYSDLYGINAAKRRYMPIGCSEHHLGFSLDINNDSKAGKTTKEQAILWVIANAHRFGFVTRKLSAKIENTAYVHVRFYPNNEDVSCLKDYNLSLEYYLELYDIIHPDKKITETEDCIVTSEVCQKIDRNLNTSIKSRSLTLKSICELLGIGVPKEFEYIQNKPVPKLTTTEVNMPSGSIFFYNKYLKDEMNHCRKAIKAGALLIFAEKQIYDENGTPLPTILIDDPVAACAKLGRSIRNYYTAKSIAVTGSAGKTTTFELLCNVISSKFITHHTPFNNANNFTSVMQLIQSLSSEHEFYIQEIGASFPKHVESSSMAVNPDVAIITNIGSAHLDLYGTREKYIKDKLSILENINEGGIAVLNIDDEILKKYAQKNDVVTFSIKNSEADYFADNIVQEANGLSVTVVEKKTGIRTSVTLDIIGLHNAYNILAVFAVARWFGMTIAEILNGLGAYHPKGTRQILRNIGGRNLYIDCFSSIDISLITSMETLSSMKCEKGHQKIAVIWELMRTGQFGIESASKIAKEVRNLNIDIVLIFGGADAKFMAQEINKGRIIVRHTNNWNEMKRWISDLSRDGDIILFKGQHMQSIVLAIDSVFGTDYYVNNAIERKTAALPFKYEEYSGVTISKKVAVIDSCDTKIESIIFPDIIDNVPVIYLNTDLCAGSDISSIVIGNETVTVGKRAFKNCKKLTSITFGKNIRYIGEEAFAGCEAIEEIVLPRSCIHISNRAFADCANLKHVVIPKNIGFIAKNAFENSDNIKYEYEYEDMV